MNFRIEFIIVFCFLSLSKSIAQFQKGRMSVEPSLFYFSLEDEYKYSAVRPTIDYVINNRMILTIAPYASYDNFEENEYKSRSFGSGMKYIVSPTKWKRKFFVEHYMSYYNSDWIYKKRRPVTTNSATLLFGVGMYRFINPNVAFFHHFSWNTTFSARRANGRYWENYYYQEKQYTLQMQNFSKITLNDSLKRKPFREGTKTADVYIGIRDFKEIHKNTSIQGSLGYFPINNLLIAIRGGVSWFGTNAAPKIRYYVPFTKRISVFIDIETTASYNFSLKDTYLYYEASSGLNYMLNDNVGLETMFIYQKDITKPFFQTADKYRSIGTNITYFF